MDLNYAKWDKVVEDDSSGDESSCGGGGGGIGDGGAGRPDIAEVGCGDPSCHGCTAKSMKALLNVPADMARASAMFDAIDNEMFGFVGGAQERFHAAMGGGTTAAAAANFAFEMGSKPSGVEAAAAAAGAAPAGATGGGAEAAESNRDERPAEVGKASRVGDPGVPYRDSVSYEEKDFCDEEEEVEDCPFNVVNDLPNSDFSVDSGEYVESDSSVSSDFSDSSDSESDDSDKLAPPLRWDSGSESEGEQILSSTTRKLKCISLYNDLHIARLGDANEVSSEFWIAMGISSHTPKSFTDYYTNEVLANKAFPGSKPPLVVPNLPLGFAEFVDFVGSADDDKYKQFSGYGFPRGLLKYSHAVARQNEKTIRGSKVILVTAKDWSDVSVLSVVEQAREKGRKRENARERDWQAAMQAAKLSGRDEAGSTARGASGASTGAGARHQGKDRPKAGTGKLKKGSSAVKESIEKQAFVGADNNRTSKSKGKKSSKNSTGAGAARAGAGGKKVVSATTHDGDDDADTEDYSDGSNGDGGCKTAVEAMKEALRNLNFATSHRRGSGGMSTAQEKQLRTSLKSLEKVLLGREKDRVALVKAEERTTVAVLAAEAAEAAAAAAMGGVGAPGGSADGGVAGKMLLSVEEALERAEALKKGANMVLTDTRYPEAVEQYTLGIKVLEPHVSPAPSALQAEEERRRRISGEDEGGGKEEAKGDSRSGGKLEVEEEEDDQKVARELMLILLCNRSLAHLKWGNLGSAKKDAQHAMDLDPHHIKAYFRRAAAHKQAERYREALSDLRYILRLEAPPVKGVAVSDDILAVQKMAKECEQKFRANGFKKAIQETNKSAKPTLPPSSRNEARDKWDSERRKGSGGGRGGGKAKISSARAMPLPRKDESSVVWENGVSYLPPYSEILSLKQGAAAAAAASIDRAPEVYVQWCKGLLSEYIGLVFERLNWVALQTMLQSGIYDEVCNISSNIQSAHWQFQDQAYRRLYAAVSHQHFLEASRQVGAAGAEGTGDASAVGDWSEQLLSPLVLSPHLGLMDVLENHSLFTYQAWDAEEEATPKLFNFSKVRSTGRAVVTRQEFIQQFNVFTEGQLEHLDWNNVVVAGGSVLASTHPPPPGPLREFYHSLAYRSSDVDLFVYGLDEKAATKKVRHIFDAVKHANPKIFAVRSLRTITLVSEFPYRKIQIVLRLYKTLAEVLHGFDVDACSVGFDGHTVWATNRAARAICKQYNVVDLSRRSPSYENRLFKYGKRGHAALVRDLQPDRVRPELKRKRAYRLENRETGLAKMIAVDACYRNFHLVEWRDYYERWNEGLLRPLSGLQNEAEIIHFMESEQEADYTTMYIPYGPRWDRERVRRHVANHINKSNSWYYRILICHPAQAPIEPVVFGNIDYVLGTGVNTGKGDRMSYSPDEETQLMHMKHVTADEMWLTKNPGAQGLLTGSFHPMTSSKADWEDGVYESRP